jgi:formylglycine-generating enzyme required for sulfatase activity
MPDWIPEMVPVPAGTFLLGSPPDEPRRLEVEGPQQTVRIGTPFAVGRFAVTVDQFAAFVADSGHPVGSMCKLWNGADFEDRPGSFHHPGFAQTGDHPAVCVSWEDATGYAAWLSAVSGRRFRLLTEAEWEYAARAGTVTPYWWGASVQPDQANANFSTLAGADGRPGTWRRHTVPVCSFAPNPWGIYQVSGNVWEWVQDEWSGSHAGVPSDGSVRARVPGASKRVLRGGSWLNGPPGLRCARRHAADPGWRRSDIGFRLAEDTMRPSRFNA